MPSPGCDCCDPKLPSQFGIRQTAAQASIFVFVQYPRCKSFFAETHTVLNHKRSHADKHYFNIRPTVFVEQIKIPVACFNRYATSAGKGWGMTNGEISSKRSLSIRAENGRVAAVSNYVAAGSVRLSFRMRLQLSVSSAYCAMLQRFGLSRGAAALMTTIFGTGIFLVGCRDQIPVALQFDEKPVYQLIRTHRFAIPTNYLYSIDNFGAFMMASWPEMEGRTEQNYTHYTKNHLSILVDSGSSKEMGLIYNIYLLEETTKGVQKRPIYLGQEYGFEHSIIRYPNAKLDSGVDTHKDIYVRKRRDGNIDALMQCSGEPAPVGTNPQCALWVMFDEFPDLSFKIGFSRRKALSQVNEIEQSVRNKFLDFRDAGEKAFLENKTAREKFLEQEGYVTQRRNAQNVDQKNGEQ